MPQHSIVELSLLTSDEDVERVLPFYNRAYRELEPRFHDRTVAELRSPLSDPSFEMHAFSIDTDDGELIGLGLAVHWLDGTNGHLQWLRLLVRPENRREGYARRLLAHAAAIADTSGRSMIIGDGYATAPSGGAFAEAIGADVGMRERISVVRVDDLDREMLAGWRQDGPSRAGGYEVLQWEDGYPLQYDGEIAALFVMADEDMPFEDAAFEAGAETAETVRARLERHEDLYKRVTSVARHRESGRIVGFSELIHRVSDPDSLATTLTVVDRDHRGHALGKWIKADCILRGVERWPNTTYIQTENAVSNAPMLGINEAIGFVEEQVSIAYQASLERIRAYLDQD